MRISTISLIAILAFPPPAKTVATLEQAGKIDFGLTSGPDGMCYFRTSNLSNSQADAYKIISSEIASWKNTTHKNSMLLLEVDFDCLNNIELEINENSKSYSADILNLHRAFRISSKNGCEFKDLVLEILQQVGNKNHKLAYRQARFMEGRVYESCLPTKGADYNLYIESYRLGFLRAFPYIVESVGIAP